MQSTVDGAALLRVKLKLALSRRTVPEGGIGGEGGGGKPLQDTFVVRQ